MKALAKFAAILASVLIALSSGFAQTPATSLVDAKSVPVIDGGLIPCSPDFTVSDPSGAPVSDAKIRVHIAYRFMNMHKLDLEVGTNADGKARFTGLPDHLKHGLDV